MDNFMIYDIVLLVIFILIVSAFLYIKRKNLKREGMLLLYRTIHGISAINKIGNKYKKTLKVLEYVSISLGYILMASVVYLFGKIIWIYIFQPNVVRAVKIPPITPLIPYLPQIFKLDFLPPFYFTYWIIIIAVVAVVHEFSHGIFAAYNKVKIKKTGFGFFPFFLPVFLAAFVELDEKNMEKKKKISQLAILSAGTFANVLTAVFFFFVLWGFFSASYMPAGVNFDTYSYSIQNISAISYVNGIHISNPSYADISKLTNGTALSTIMVGNKTFFLTNNFLQSQQNVKDYILLYDNSPAIKANLTGAIIKIDGVKITSPSELASQLIKDNPGETITVETKTGNTISDYKIVLAENPGNKNLPYLGIGFNVRQTTGLSGIINSVINFMKQPNVYYEAKYPAADFIYNLLWWLVLISMSVALVNMLPMGIFDGGRFFMLTIWGITKNKETAQKIFKFITFLFLLLVLVMMIFWVVGIVGK